MTDDGTVKLLDFGMAKLLETGSDEGHELTGDGRALTPLYAAPEQVRGEPITTATVVYAIGHHPFLRNAVEAPNAKPKANALPTAAAASAPFRFPRMTCEDSTGVVAYLVGQRRREIGICIALGASQRSVVAIVAAEVFGMMGVGVTAGLAGRARIFTIDAQSPLWNPTH